MAARKTPHPEGRNRLWLRAHVEYDGADCLMWPFGKCNGYGVLGSGERGKAAYAHRVMCEMVNGPAPTPGHEAAHSCGRGDQGCVHPKHVSWKTRGENQKDRAAHGTGNVWGGRGRLTDAEIEQIKALRGKMKQADIAAMFNTSRANVSNIQLGRWGTRKQKGWVRYGNRYYAKIGEKGRYRTIGIFDTAEEAHAAWKAENDRIRAMKRAA
jgi:hypothetical protein